MAVLSIHCIYFSYQVFAAPPSISVPLTTMGDWWTLPEWTSFRSLSRPLKTLLTPSGKQVKYQEITTITHIFTCAIKSMTRLPNDFKCDNE